MTDLTLRAIKYDDSATTLNSSSADYSIVDVVASIPGDLTSAERFGDSWGGKYQPQNAHTYDQSSVYPMRSCKGASAVLREVEKFLDPISISDEDVYGSMVLHDLIVSMPPKESRKIKAVIRARQIGKPAPLEDFEQ